VPGHPPPRTRFFLTDVRFAPRFSVISFVGAWAPGAEILPAQPRAPRSVGPREYEGLMRADMNESQAVAAIVAERAAGLRVPPLHEVLVVVGFAPGSRAAGSFRAGEALMSVNGAHVVTAFDVRRVLAAHRPGEYADVVAADRGRLVHQRVRLSRFGARTVLGVYLMTLALQPKLPVPIQYHVTGVGGSSGGLMFALDIYQTLRPPRAVRFRRVAGTGTIAFDGTVGAIEGTRQKLAAARAARATVFFVPRDNYGEVSNARGIRVVPVRTFADALRVLGT